VDGRGRWPRKRSSTKCPASCAPTGWPVWRCEPLPAAWGNSHGCLQLRRGHLLRSWSSGWADFGRFVIMLHRHSDRLRHLPPV